MKRYEVTVRAITTHVVHAHSVEAAEQAAFALAMPQLRDTSWGPESVSAVMTGQVFAYEVEAYRKKLLGMFQVIQEKEKKIAHLISMDPRLDSDNMDELHERERWMNLYGARLDRIIERDEKE